MPLTVIRGCQFRITSIFSGSTLIPVIEIIKLKYFIYITLNSDFLISTWSPVRCKRSSTFHMYYLYSTGSLE
jgi:uncharacterized protein YchJ